eukprot:gene11594-2304_t
MRYSFIGEAAAWVHALERLATPRALGRRVPPAGAGAALERPSTS